MNTDDNQEELDGAPEEQVEETVEATTPEAKEEADKAVEAKDDIEAPSASSDDEQPKAEDVADKDSEGKPEIPGADLEVDIVVEEKIEKTTEDSEFSQYAEEYAYTDGEELEDSDSEKGDDDDDEPVLPEKILDVEIDLGKSAQYLGTGKRKSAVARVRLLPGDGTITVNGKEGSNYFPRPAHISRFREPLEIVGYEERLNISVNVYGGGISSQSSAIRHGVARALIEAQPNLRSQLKVRGFLTRDARVKERKKAGLKKARKRPQFSKR